MQEPPNPHDPLSRLAPPRRPERLRDSGTPRDPNPYPPGPNPLDDLLPPPRPMRPQRAPKPKGSGQERGVLQIVVPLLGLAAICALGIKPPDRPSSARPVLLDDGGKIALEAVTYGKAHQFVRGNWVQKFLVYALPDGVQRWIGGSIATHTAETENALVFWTVRRLGALPPAAQVRVAGVDSSERESFVGRRCFQTRLGKTEVLEGWVLPAFPRRGNDVRLRVYERGPKGWAQQPTFEFDTPNPTPGPHEAWKPLPLPQTEHHGEHSFTLARLITNVDLNQPAQRARKGHPGGTLAYFSATTGTSASGWFPERATLRDSTGNTLPLGATTRREGSGFRLMIPGMLWSGESAWKLGAVFSRTTGFASEEIYRFQPVAVPGKGSAVHSDETGTFAGTSVVFHGIVGPGGKLRGAPSVTHPRPAIILRVRPNLEDIRLTVVRVLDERGRRLSVTPQPLFRRGGYFGFGLDSPGAARKVEVSVAVHESRVVEFLAKPTER